MIIWLASLSPLDAQVESLPAKRIMYGLVNQAIEDLVTSNFGEDRWAAIKSKAGVDEEVFISNASYPDDTTYKLVGAASEVLGLPVDDILVAFGKHWVLKTALESYGPMMKATGENLREFLENLPNFHTRVALLFPNLQPPKFTVSNVSDEGLDLHYHTHRNGLTNFVIGLVHGLGEMYDTECVVDVLARKSDEMDHDIFRIAWKTPIKA